MLKCVNDAVVPIHVTLARKKLYIILYECEIQGINFTDTFILDSTADWCN